VQSCFDDASRQAEKPFAIELTNLVSCLTERRSGQEVGRPQDHLIRVNRQPVATD
jgi:hypothetical protein